MAISEEEFKQKLQNQETKFKRRIAAESLKGPQPKLTPLQIKNRKVKPLPKKKPIKKLKRKPIIGAIRG